MQNMGILKKPAGTPHVNICQIVREQQHQQGQNAVGAAISFPGKNQYPGQKVSLQSRGGVKRSEEIMED